MIAPWYALAYVGLERVAWRHGYALAIHGSMARDLDLVAIPWTDDADDPEKLITAFVRFVVAKSGVEIKRLTPAQKAHGRLAYAVPISYGNNNYYLDVSVMPREKGGAK